MIHVFKNLFTIHKHNYCKCAVYATLVGYDPWIVNYRCKSIIYQHNCYIPVLIIHVYMDFMSPLVFFNLKEQQIQLLFLFQACYVNETIVIVAALIIHVYMDFMCKKCCNYSKPSDSWIIHVYMDFMCLESNIKL